MTCKHCVFDTILKKITCLCLTQMDVPKKKHANLKTKNIFVYQKALIQTFHLSFLTTQRENTNLKGALY